MKLWLTAAEIADLALPGLPATKRNVNAFAEIAGWGRRPGLSRARRGAGGGLEYHLDLLPPDARRAYVTRVMPDAVPEAVAEAAEAEPAAAYLRDDAAEARDARLAILAAADRIFASAKLPRHNADLLAVADYAAGRLALPDWVHGAVPKLTLRSLQRWRATARDGRTAALAVDRGAARRGLGVADAASLARGFINVAVLAEAGHDPDAVTARVRAWLSRDDVKGGTDILDVRPAIVATPEIRATLYALHGPAEDVLLGSAEQSLRAFAAQRGPFRTPLYGQAIDAALKVPGIEYLDRQTPRDDVLAPFGTVVEVGAVRLDLKRVGPVYG